ncbi:hypothetical protein QFZ76_003505 [Streptomyces sp. V4I2]|nr:hypothetical protein [Streptomyces sp. V4I2]
MVPPGRGERLPMAMAMAMARALVVSAAVGEERGYCREAGCGNVPLCGRGLPMPNCPRVPE